MSEAEKTRGRPKLSAGLRRRHNQTFRIRDALRDRIAEAAKANQRSVSEQVEWILEAHFERASIFDEIAARIVAKDS